MDIEYEKNKTECTFKPNRSMTKEYTKQKQIL